MTLTQHDPLRCDCGRPLFRPDDPECITCQENREEAAHERIYGSAAPLTIAPRLESDYHLHLETTTMTDLTEHDPATIRRRAEEARQVAVKELRRQLREFEAERIETLVIDVGNAQGPQIICPFCGSQDVEYTETTWNHREILRIDTKVPDDASLIIDTQDHISPESEDEHLICNECATELKIPAALTIEWE